MLLWKYGKQTTASFRFKGILWNILLPGVSIGLYITDDRGRIRNKDGNLGIQSLSAPVRVSEYFCKDSAVKHHDLLSWKDWTIVNGQTRQLKSSTTAHIKKFRALNHCVKYMTQLLGNLKFLVPIREEIFH